MPLPGELFDNIVVPIDQIRLIDPYQVRIYKDDTIHSDVFLSRVVNSLYTIFGNDIVISGFDFPEEQLTFNEGDVLIAAPPGRVLQDTTLLNIMSSTTLTYKNLGNEDPEGRLVVFCRYKYLKTLEPNKVRLTCNYIPIHKNSIPAKSFDENTDRTLLAIYKFTVDENHNVTSIILSDERYIDIKLESGMRRYWVGGYDPDAAGLKKYFVKSILDGFYSGSGSSIIWDADVSYFKLINDIGDPGIYKYYGTDGSAVKGWYDLPPQLLAPLDQDKKSIWIFRDTGNKKYNQDLIDDPFDSLEINNSNYDIEPNNLVLTTDASVTDPIYNEQSFKISEVDLSGEDHSLTFKNPKLIKFWESNRNKPTTYGLELDDRDIKVLYKRGRYYRLSFYAKRGPGLWKLGLRLDKQIFDTDNPAEVYYDLQNNIVQYFDPSPIGQSLIKDWGIYQTGINNWVKCWVTFRCNNNNTSIDELCKIFTINPGLILSDNTNAYLANSSNYFGNQLASCHLYGLKLTSRDYYHFFNDGEVTRDNNKYTFILDGADTYNPRNYLVYVNGNVIGPDLYDMSYLDDRTAKLVIDINDVYLDDKSEVVIKQLEVNVDLDGLKFTQLGDTPNTYARAIHYLVRVNQFENRLEFIDPKKILYENVMLLDTDQVINDTKIFTGTVIFTGNVIIPNIIEQPVINSPIYDNFIILNRGDEGPGVTLVHSGVRIWRGEWPGAEIRYNEFYDQSV